MIDRQRAEKLLQQLARTIELSEGEFTLLIAHCNYTHLRKALVQQLQQQCLLKIRSIRLKASATTLCILIREEFKPEYPTALTILGLESVEAIEELLTSTNQMREEFRKHFPCPLLLWVNDRLLRQFIRIAPDFTSWGIDFHFKLTAQELIDFLQLSVDKVFAEVLTAEQFVSTVKIFNSFEQSKEIELAQKELQAFKIDLTPELQAGSEFLFGRDEYVNNRIEQALNHYQKSLAFWQQESATQAGENQKRSLERQGIVLFHMGLSYCRQADRSPTESQRYWQEAKKTFQQCLDSFEQAQRPDLIAQFIGQLGKMLACLEEWDELERLAQIAATLHQNEGNEHRLAQDYGCLAEVALHRFQWQEARQWAELALSTLEKTPIKLHKRQGFYRLFLAQALQELGQPSAAIATLEVAIQEGKPKYDPRLYICLLETLRNLYFQQKEYLKAFRIKQSRCSLEQQYRLRPFIGAGRLQPQLEPEDPEKIVPQKKVQPTFAASGRQRDVDFLINERIGLPRYKLTVLYGPSGVGKSSLISAGLVPELQQKPIHNRHALPVVMRVYNDWVKELGKRLTIALETPAEQGNNYLNSLDAIQTQLKTNAENQLLTVLIFDQFEEFFFAHPESDERQKFYQFLQICLKGKAIPFVKVILSIREDSLDRLLECKRFTEKEALGYNPFAKEQRYYIGNFSPQTARSVIQDLTERTPFRLQSELMQALVRDLASNLEEEVRPIELQIVGAQLQEDKIATLEQYQQLGNNPKTVLVQRWLESVVKDCGEEHWEAAWKVLASLTDAKGRRPRRTRQELIKALQTDLLGDVLLKTAAKEIAQALSFKSQHEISDKKLLQNILEIFEGSGLIVTFYQEKEPCSQLVHDYWGELIRSQYDFDIEKRLAEAEQAYTQLQKLKKRFLIGAIATTILLLGSSVVIFNLSYQARRVKEAIAKAYPDRHPTEKDLETIAIEVVATFKLAEAEKVVKEGKVKEAIDTYKIAQELSPKLEISATFWNTICWDGSLRSYREGNFKNYANELLEACNKAVDLGKTARFFDSRGVARALIGNRQGAIADFEQAIELSSDNDNWISKQNTRIKILHQGKNPFTMEKINKLLNL